MGEPGQPTYAYRIFNSMLGSELVPAFLRTKAMQRLGFEISDDVCIWGNASFRSSKVKIGRDVFINVGFFHDGFDMLTIGDHVRIGQYVRVLTATHDIGPSVQRGTVETIGEPVRIDDGCWIGSGAIILPGVHLARGCVLAAGAVLAHSTEPDGLYAGNPANRVRDLEP